MLRSEDVTKVIEKDLMNQLPFLNEQYDYDVRKDLLIPKLESYTNSTHREIKYSLWTVWESDNWIVFYDEDEKVFGWGIRSDGLCYYYAHVGDFAFTLERL